MPHITARKYNQDKLNSVNWAKDLLDGKYGDWCILDTETTGLNWPEIIDICIISKYRSPMINTRLKPVKQIESGATYIHGLTNESLSHAPSFKDVRDRIAEIVKDRIVIIYNKNFDTHALFNTACLHDMPRITFKSECAMVRYAEFYGEWSGYWGNYKWQKLPGGDHTAYGDCLATHDLIQLMAAWEPELEIEVMPQSDFKLPIEIGCNWEPRYWVKFEKVENDYWNKKLKSFAIKLPRFYVIKNNSDRFLTDTSYLIGE